MYQQPEQGPCSPFVPQMCIHLYVYTFIAKRIWVRNVYVRSMSVAVNTHACEWTSVYCKPNNFWQSSNLAVQNGFISRGSSGIPQLFRVEELGGSEYKFWSFCKPLIVLLTFLKPILFALSPYLFSKPILFTLPRTDKFGLEN
jgi:hypothetical protein